MRTYKIIGEGINEVIEMTEEDGTIRFVPKNPDNSDYQAYLESLNEAKTK